MRGGCLSPREFVRQSLELNLFFLRIMKEHSFFLEAGFVRKDQFLAQQADLFKERFNELLSEAVLLANRNISNDAIDSEEFVTRRTLPAERKSQELSGISIDTALTMKELKLAPGKADPELKNEVRALNERAINLTKELIIFKTKILDAMLKCKLLTFNFPLLIEHIRREARLFVELLQQLNRGQELDPQRMIREDKIFWDRIMSEHAQFIAHLLDPTEEDLIDQANQFAKLFRELEKKTKMTICIDQKLVAEETRATKNIRNFKAAATDLLLACEVRSIIIPLLGDHVLREANHFLRLLQQARND